MCCKCPQPAAYLRLQETRDLVNKALRPHDKDHMEIDVVFNREKETVLIRKDNIENLVQSIMHFHPHCTLYAKAWQRLIKAEKAFKKQGFDWSTYNDVSIRVLDIYHPVYQEDIDDLIDLGITPMSMIDYDNKCRFYYNILIRKQWRSRVDNDKNTDSCEIAKRMADDLRADPVSAFLTNRYLPSAVMWNMVGGDW
jgi:hypothetical protein